ncbi:MAG: pyridoxal-phosphate dependent enzyme [Candidatus Dojkabacteria bacterium]
MSIWDYKTIKESINLKFSPMDLKEGSTAVDTLSEDPIPLYLKREDLNPTGSWKDRGTAYKINELKNGDVKEGVLFSSGNALISFLEYLQLYPAFKLNCVVSNNVAANKLNIIQGLIANTQHELIITENPKKKAIQISAEKGIPNLRISLDNDIVKGYWSLGIELGKLIKSFKEFKEGTVNKDIALFIQASSGTAAVGTAEGLFLELEKEYLMPRIIICQTEQIHPFVNQDTYSGIEKSLADAIVDSVGLRQEQIAKIIRETNGSSLFVDNKEIEDAKTYLEERTEGGEEVSYTSLVSLAGFLKYKQVNEMKRAICIFSGR